MVVVPTQTGRFPTILAASCGGRQVPGKDGKGRAWEVRGRLSRRGECWAVIFRAGRRGFRLEGAWFTEPRATPSLLHTRRLHSCSFL